MNWHQLLNPETIASPGLLVDPDRISQNIQSMIATVGGHDHVSRLRPHVKTYKMPEVVRLQMAAGIHRFKAATISEAQMVADTGADDVLLAYQPVGPNVDRLAYLVNQFPNTDFAAITDNIDSARQIADRLRSHRRPFRLFIDVDCGMHRTGIALGPELERLRDWIGTQPGIHFAGLHVYDGHVHDVSFTARREKANVIIDTIKEYDNDRSVPAVIGGGSPTFACWAAKTTWQCSPGTTLLWDVGYGKSYPDLDFCIAAALLTRVISKPTDNLLCLDLGYKAVASEMPLEERVTLPAIPDAQPVGHSEEHLVFKTSRAADFSVGDCLLVFPKHICPTVALHAYATVIRDGTATDETWRVTARDR